MLLYALKRMYRIWYRQMTEDHINDSIDDAVKDTMWVERPFLCL